MIKWQRKYLLLPTTTLLLLFTAELRAAETITISGRISTFSGEPAGGAEVFLYSSVNTRKPADFISPKASSDGFYRMIVPKAQYRGIARLKKGERYGPLMPGDRHSGEPVTIESDEEKELNLDFTVADLQEMAQRREKRGGELAEIAGSVTADGKSIASIYVYARTGRLVATLPEFFSEWTGVDGRYRLMLPPGQYFLGTATEFPPPETAAALQEVNIAAGKLPIAINLHIPLK